MSLTTVSPSGAATAGPDGSTSALPTTVGRDLLVPTPQGPVDYANLDHAATTPALVAVAEAVQRASATYASVHRGNGYASRVTSRWYEQARLEVAGFLGARPDDHVVLTRGTTDSWSLLAACLPADTTVVVFAAEHHSTLLPWGRGRTVVLPVPATVAEAMGRLEATLAAVTTRHAMVVVTGASNVTGELWPVARVVATAARYGARVALDAAQLAPHRRIDLTTSGVDYLALSGHKLYAPFGAGVLVGRADWLDAAEPYLVGGGATTRVFPGPDAAPRPQWATGPGRHEGGSPNALGAIALAAACATLRREWTAVARHEAVLTERLRRGLAAVPGVQLLALFPHDGLETVGVVPFTVAGLDSAEVSAALSFRYGIGVRDGRFCAHLLVDHLLESDVHDTAVRASLGLATTAEHVDRLVGAVAELAAEALAARRAGTVWRPPADPLTELDAVRPW